MSPAAQSTMIQKLSVRSSPVTGDILSPRTPEVGASFAPSTSDTKPPSLVPSTPLRYLPLDELEVGVLVLVDEVVVGLLVLEVVRVLDVVVVLDELVVVVELDEVVGGGGGVSIFL